MSTNTQIKTYLIPEKVWNEGISGNNQISPLLIPARDALEIERRRNNNINLRNEDHRYTMACERIQSLAVETCHNCTDIPEPTLWPAYLDSELTDQVTALAYLSTMETLYKVLYKSIGKLPYRRFLALFFPPYDKESHLKLYQFLVNHPQIDELVQRASNLSKRMGPSYEVTARECKLALIKRRDLLIVAQTRNFGLVDVIEIV